MSKTQTIEKREILTPAEVADWLSVPVQLLAQWRYTGTPALAFVRIGRMIRYERSAVEAFIAAGRVEAASR